MKVYGISYCELPVSGFSASPRDRDIFRASVCVSLTVIDCFAETEGERRKKKKKKERDNLASYPNCKSRGIIFSGLWWAVPEVKIHRWDLSLRVPQDNIARHLLHSLRHSYIPVVNDNSILRRFARSVSTSVIFTLLKLENYFIILQMAYVCAYMWGSASKVTFLLEIYSAIQNSSRCKIMILDTSEFLFPESNQLAI